MRNLNGFLLWSFILLNGLNYVKPASILGGQEDTQSNWQTLPGVETPKTNVMQPVNVPAQGAGVQNEYPSNVERRPIIDNDGLDPSIPKSDPGPQNLDTQQAINTNIQNQPASFGNELQPENVVQAVDNPVQTDNSDREPSQNFANGIGTNTNEILSTEKQNQGNGLPPVSEAGLEQSALPLVNNYAPQQDGIPVNVNGAASLTNSENLGNVNTDSSQTSTGNTQGFINEVKPVVNGFPVNGNVGQSQNNYAPFQNPISANESPSKANIEQKQDSMSPNEAKPFVNQVPVDENIVQSQNNNYEPVQNPIDGPFQPIDGPFQPIDGPFQSQIEPITEQTSVNEQKPIVDYVQGVANEAMEKNAENLDSNLPATENKIISNEGVPQIEDIHAMQGEQKGEQTGIENNLEHQITLGNTQGQASVDTGTDSDDGFYEDTTSSSDDDYDYEDDDDYNYDDDDDDKDDDNGDIFNTKWWDNDDKDDWFDDDEYNDDKLNDDDEDDDEDDESWDYWENEGKSQVTATSTTTTTKWKDTSTAEETTEDSVDAGKGLMESVHHFDSNFGPFAGAKVSNKSRNLGGDGFAYSWTLLVSLCLVLICLFIFWNRQKVEKYIVSLRQPSPSKQNKGILSKDEEKNLLDNEYT